MTGFIADVQARTFTTWRSGIFLEDVRAYRERQLAGPASRRSSRSGAATRPSWRRR